MVKKYIVELTLSEKEELIKIINKGKVPGYKIKHANILLKADEGENGERWTDTTIAKAYNVHFDTVRNVRKRFVEKGLKEALEREKRTNYKRKLDGDAEAKLIAIACSTPPDGRSQWSLRLLADKMVELEIVDMISHSTIQQTLKKMNLSHGSRNSGVYQKHQENL